MARRAVLGVLPANALEREFSNSNALFTNDFYYKFGTKPKPIEDVSLLPGKPTFVRLQVRYDALRKYRANIEAGLDAFNNLKDESSAKIVLKSLIPMGLLANNLLAAETTTNELLLARYYINEVYFRLTGDMDIDGARPYLASYLVLVNRAIVDEPPLTL